MSRDDEIISSAITSWMDKNKAQVLSALYMGAYKASQEQAPSMAGTLGGKLADGMYRWLNEYREVLTDGIIGQFANAAATAYPNLAGEIKNVSDDSELVEVVEAASRRFPGVPVSTGAAIPVGNGQVDGDSGVDMHGNDTGTVHDGKEVAD